MLKEQDTPSPADASHPASGGPHSNRASHDSGNANAARSGLPLWRRLLSVKVIVGIVIASLVLHAIVFGLSRWSAGGPATADAAGGAEVTLGEFQFAASPHERGPVQAARFQLHLAFLPEVDAAARLRLGTHKFRVQQDIEQLMRQAHGGDFDDPALVDLKRQIQEQVNETLGMRAVADVIVTDLELERSSHLAGATGGGPAERPVATRSSSRGQPLTWSPDPTGR